MITIDEDTEFIIYGAGPFGRQICDYFLENGFRIVCFFDKNAGSLKKYKEIGIFHPADNNVCSDKEKVIVFLSLVDIFAHESLARELAKLGYHNILCKRNVIGYEGKNNVNHIYDLICEKKSVIGQIFDTDGDDFCIKDHALIRAEGKEVTAYIPASLLFMHPENSLAESIDAEVDIPIFSAFYIFELFKNLSCSDTGDHPIQPYLDRKLLIRSKYSENYQAESIRIYEGRRNVFNKMILALSLDRDFFLRHPVSVTWNERGYFIIHDGLHRSAFLILNGFIYIPCKMLLSDYNKWINADAARNVLNYMYDNNISQLLTPVPNGYFYYFPIFGELTYIIRLFLIDRYLGEKNIRVEGKKVLDLSAGIGYFAQHFRKRGASVTAYEPKASYAELFTKLNDLLYCRDISVCQHTAEIPEKGYEILVYIPVLLDNDRLNVLDLTQFISNSNCLFFFETSNPEDVIAIMQNTCLKEYSVLQKREFPGGCVYLYVCTV